MTDDTGTYRCYIPRKFNTIQLNTIDNANKIIAEYEPAGMSLTVRQLYYQFVARGMMENDISNYNRFGSLLSDARLAGLVSWTAIEDRGRALMSLNPCEDHVEALKRARDNYHGDLWRTQHVRPEVWVEKQALEGVIGAICDELRVDFFATKGYNSQSEAWRAGRRFAHYIQRGQRPIVFHLGDHDPSGLDMTRDNQERLSLFAGVPITVIRLALNFDQIEEYDPPPNPTKHTDSRSDAYRAEFGESSWEVDALEPTVIQGIIEEAVEQYKDQALWDAELAKENEEKDSLDIIIETAS